MGSLHQRLTTKYSKLTISQVVVTFPGQPTSTYLILNALEERASLVAQMVKNPPAIQEIQVRSLGWEVPLKEGMATHSSIHAWRIQWTEEPGGLQAIGSHRVEHNWSNLSQQSIHSPWREALVLALLRSASWDEGGGSVQFREEVWNTKTGRGRREESRGRKRR